MLMFLMRGMYPSDVANFTVENLEEIDGAMYLRHRRSKTSEQANPDMVIGLRRYYNRAYNSLK